MPLPPLVSPEAELSAAERSRYSRHILIPEIGIKGQRRLKRSRVLVIGAGGLGSPALLYLAAAGVGTLGIVDFDRVEASNLQRQVIHRMSTVGQPKAESARQAIADLNPFVHVEIHPQRLDNDNVLELFARYDLVVDATDNFATRYLINDACVLAGKPYVWGSVYRMEGQASVFWENAPEQLGLNYRDLYPEPPPPELAPSCSEGGVLGVLCATIASIMGAEAIKLITGNGESLLGRLLIHDALQMSFRTLPIRRAPDRSPIAALVDYQHFCEPSSNAESVEDAALRSIDVTQLKQWFDTHQPFQLLDVREQTEWAIVRIPGSQLVPKQRLLDKLSHPLLSPSRRYVVCCKSGARSRQVVRAMQDAGFEDVFNLDGGVLAWVQQIDPTLAVY